MASERKQRTPLISVGAAAGSAPLSLHQKIIAKDAERNGRPIPNFDTNDTAENITSNTVSNISANITAQEEISEDAPEVMPEDSQPRRQQAAKPRTSTRSNKPAPQSPAEKAIELADGKADPITLRLPEGLNDYLDDLQHTHRKSGIKKQDLVRIAIQLLVIEAENGGDIVAMSKGEF